jgi:CRISPR-associated protein Csb1
MALITLKEAKGKKKRYMPASSWWKAFTTIFRYDPNALVHGVLFPQWQIKIARALTAHLEACGAARVDRSGVKFDRLGKTTSGQPIFAVDDATAREITATFILDVSLIKSFGRKDGETQFGLDDSQQEFLVALALWKVRRLLESPFRFRSGCHLETASLRAGDRAVEIDVNIQESISSVNFSSQNGASPITDIYWPVGELYREAQGDEKAEAADVAEIEDENE